MERLDEMLGRGSKSPVWPSAIDDPPRKLLLAAPVLQVVNSDTIQTPFLELTKPNPSDRKFVVKNVVLLRNLRFSGEREEPQSRNVPRNALTQSFVEQFANDADQAIVSLFSGLGQPDDPLALARLLFRTPEIDRAQLGDYLSRRTSRVVLKHYLDVFGFTGVRVDKALRIFLQTINISTRPIQGVSPLDILLDSFASRWYDANGKQIAYDKDLAFRFSRAIVQLNEVLHGGLSQEPGSTRYIGRNVTARDFLDAFRRHDPRGLLSDDTLSDVYESVYREPLSQARCPSSNGPAEITVTFKRALPSRLTYKVQSEPVVIRIPQPDPNFTIELFGHNLAFEPPVLSFSKSSEASFRVTGTLFGPTTMLILRSGANALLYAGLPPSCPISVERAFMRNTFQVAFLNHSNILRRYMFSFADPLVRHEWATSLKRLTDASINITSAGPNASPFQARFARAVGDIVFRVLQETLIGPEAFTAQRPPGKLNNVLRRLNSTNHSHHDSQFSLSSRDITGSVDLVRSKSKSKVYHHYGPGKLEAENSRMVPYHSRSSSEEDGDGSDSRRAEERLWSGKDLEMFCKQNSSIAQVVELLLPTTSNQPIQSQ
ncbi:Sec7 domain-containing protein [Chiua virens]|nr:Sec7 domain-containing protein [Chiua virens]